MKKLVIDRSRWLRGEHPCDSALHRAEDGKMCCLGLYLESCGVPAERMTNRKYPSALRSELPREALWLVAPGYVDQDAIPTRLAVINDKRSILPAVREHQIAALFGAMGIEVAFVNGPPAQVSSDPKVKP